MKELPSFEVFYIVYNSVKNGKTASSLSAALDKASQEKMGIHCNTTTNNCHIKLSFIYIYIYIYIIYESIFTHKSQQKEKEKEKEKEQCLTYRETPKTKI